MKALLFITILFYQLLSDELKWIENQIQAIKPSRDGIDKNFVDNIKNPFISLKRETQIKKTHSKNKIQKQASKKTTSETFKLDAIINSSALINNKWYKNGEKVGKYILIIETNSKIKLKYKSEEISFSTKGNNKSLKFENY
jgi:hypothetical protein